MIKRVWMSFLQKSLILQFIAFSFVVSIITIIFSLFLLNFGAPDVWFAFEYILFGSDFEWSKNQSVAQYLRFAYQGVLVFLIAIWQAVLIFRLMFSSSPMRFSKRMAFYDSDVIRDGKGRETREQLVFRLMNDGEFPVYNVRITAIFRYLDGVSNTFQHYHLIVPSNEFSVFDVGMPFRIYIDVGLIEEAIDKKCLFVSSLDFSCPDVDFIDFPDAPVDASVGHKFMIIVESFDSFLDKINIVKYEYDFNQLVRGRFDNIRSIREIKSSAEYLDFKHRRGWDYFYPEEVYSKFDVINENSV